MLAWNVAPSALLDGFGGVLLAVLGLAVWRLRPSTAATRGLALFALGVGLATAPNLVVATGAERDAFRVVNFAFFLLGAVGLARVGLAFPGPLQPRERRWLPGAVLVGATVAAAGLGPILARGWETPGDGPWTLNALLAGGWGATVIAVSIWWAVLALLAARYAEPAGEPDTARSLVLMTAALALYPSTTGAFFLTRDDAWFHLLTAATLLAAVAVAALWLRNAARSAAPRIPRNVALFVLGVTLAILLYASITDGVGGIFGLTRVLSVLILAYAILRHQLLGLDVKVRWTVKQSTVAAVFIMVFFVASEGAQAFFGEVAGSQWLGIGAAGLLVFAMAPLQRAAERVASAAIPDGSARPARTAADEDLFRAQLRFALRDRAISPEEEVHLAAVAERLGLGPRRTAELRVEVEGEVSARRERARRPRPR